MAKVVGMESKTLSDFAKLLGADHQIAKIIEILEQTNEILSDAMFLEANNVTTHRTTIRNGLPESFWRTLNRGVPRSKSTTIQHDDSIGILETWAVVDKALAELNGMKAAFMLSENKPFIESMNQTMAETIFYGNLQNNKAAFTGLAPRYSTLDPAKAESARNVIDAGGTSNFCTSAWLCVWGDQTMHMIYPKGSHAGLQKDDMGKTTVVDEDNNEYRGYKTNYSWSAGLCVRDWRYVARVANIDTQQLETMLKSGAAGASAQMLSRCMIKAHSLIPNIRAGRAAWYMNRSTKMMLDFIAAEKSNVNLTIKNFEGEEVTAFKGIPIRQCDAILDTEAPVTA
ncbi:MAG: hypothetical protein LUG50_09840 [Planctomycetaceae bacterium]|nr:hypothetical protein [Planctomycetaceae bacterium]